MSSNSAHDFFLDPLADLPQPLKPKPRGRLAQVNRELWLLLSLFIIAGVLNFLVDSQRMVLGFYALPTLYSAYTYGRRHATLTAFASVFLVFLVTYFNPVIFTAQVFHIGDERWFDITIWGGTLVITAYAMGTLYERKEAHLKELRDSYHGILMILEHIASNDKYTQNHSYRVSICATRIAERMDLSSQRVEDVRAAALLHEVEKLGISRDVLYKAANMTEEEFHKIQQQLVKNGELPVQPVGGSLRRVIPVLLSLHTAEDGQTHTLDPNAPLEARILLVADTYEMLTSDRDSRMSPREAIEAIVRRRGIDLDAKVVEAFTTAFQHGVSRPVPAHV
jgi:hypothetical protein